MELKICNTQNFYHDRDDEISSSSTTKRVDDIANIRKATKEPENILLCWMKVAKDFPPASILSNAHSQPSFTLLQAKWNSLFCKRVCIISTLPDVMKKCFYAALAQLRYESSAFNSTDTSEATLKVVSSMRLSLRRIVNELIDKLIHLDLAISDKSFVNESNKSFFELLRHGERDALRLACLTSMSGVWEDLDDSTTDKLLLMSIRKMYFAEQASSPGTGNDSVNLLNDRDVDDRLMAAKKIYNKVTAAIEFDKINNLDNPRGGDILLSLSEWRKCQRLICESCSNPWTDEDKTSLLRCMEALYVEQKGNSSSTFSCVNWCDSASCQDWEAVSWMCRGSRTPAECFLMATLLQRERYVAFNSSNEYESMVKRHEILWSMEDDENICLLFTMEEKWTDHEGFPLTGHLLRTVIGGGKLAVACLAKWCISLRFTSSVTTAQKQSISENELHGMMLDFLTVRQQLEYPRLGVAFVWVIFAVCFRTESRRPDLSYLLWSENYDRLKSITFSEFEILLFRSAYVKSKSRDILWENLRISINHLDTLHMSPGVNAIAKAKPIEYYLLLLMNIEIDHRLKHSDMNLSNQENISIPSASRKRPYQSTDMFHAINHDVASSQHQPSLSLHDTSSSATVSALISSPPIIPREVYTNSAVTTCDISWDRLPLSSWLDILTILGKKMATEGVNDLYQQNRFTAASEGDYFHPVLYRLMTNKVLLKQDSAVCAQAITKMMAAIKTVKAWKFDTLEVIYY